MPVTRKMRADLDAKVSADNSSENQGTKQRSFKKNSKLVLEKPSQATTKRKPELPQMKLEPSNRKSVSHRFPSPSQE